MSAALLTAYDKEGIVEFARALIEQDYEIFASAGTAEYLKKNGLEATNVATLVGEPILDHRVVTLSREIHAGLMAEHVPQDLAELERSGIPYIDLLYVDTYPIEQAIAAPGATVESVKKLTDIGGPALLRSAAKGRRVVLCKKVQLPQALKKLQQQRSGQISETEWNNYLLFCAWSAELYVSEYTHASGSFMKEQWLQANLERAA